MSDACGIKYESWDLPEEAATALPVMFRTYARKEGNDKPRETVRQVKQRVINGLLSLGKFTKEEEQKIKLFLQRNELFSSGRYMWCGGTKFSEKPENYYSLYNCSNITIESWKDISHNFNFLMQGNGAGAKLEYTNVDKLPSITSLIVLTIEGKYGDVKDGQESTTVEITGNDVLITVGDSRLGWCDALETLLNLSSTPVENDKWNVIINVSNVRQKGELIKGFGGVTNPTGLKPLFTRTVEILTGAFGRQLKPLEVSFLLNESAKCTVAGNVRRSARIDQFSKNDFESGSAKTNLWIQDEDGNWKVDPKRDALRMANFTRVWHELPSLEEIKEALVSQFHSGEGAIQFAPEAIARSNADFLDTPNKKKEFIKLYCEDKQSALQKLIDLGHSAGTLLDDRELDHRMNRYGLNPCLSGDTLIPVKEQGLLRIKDIAESGKEVLVRDGSGNWVLSKAQKTGLDQKLLRVELSDGSVYHVTPYHDFVDVNGSKIKAKDLIEGQKLKTSSPLEVHGSIHNPDSAYRDAWLIADGTWHNSKQNELSSKLYLYEPKYDHEAQLVSVGAKFSEASSSNQVRKVAYFPGVKYLSKDSIPDYVLQGDLETKLAFIDGYLQADGTESITAKGWIVQITSIKRTFLEDMQALLRTLGVFSTIALYNPAGYRELPTHDGFGGHSSYYCQDAYRLTISNPLALFAYIRPERVKRGPYQKDRSILVKSVSESDRTEDVYCFGVPTTGSFDLPTVHSGNCGEILGNNFFCNLVEVHLNMLSEKPEEYIREVFYYAGLECSALLSHEFDIEKFRYSREIDPIVGVSFTGLFDFFVMKFGKEWLDWWAEGRPHDERGQHFLNEEARYLSDWKEAARQGVSDYCNRIGTRVPSRYTTVQPAGTKSLLTGASPGWHPPKGPRFIRRITFAKDDPVAKACIDYGYSVVPAQKDTDEEGNLLNDPFDPRCTEWLVEIPVEVSWANLEGCDSVNTDQFSVKAQFDFFMQVQNHYTTHNTSATLEYREHEIDDFAHLLHENISNFDGYMSAAMMARFDSNQTFPRLPFEPISKEQYEQEMASMLERRKSDDFYFSLMQYDIKVEDFAGPSGCDGDKCLMPEKSLN